MENRQKRLDFKRQEINERRKRTKKKFREREKKKIV